VIRAQADTIERLGPRPATADQRATLEARVGRIDAAVAAALGGGGEVELGDRVRALLAMYRAEQSRLKGPGDPARWSACVAAWQAIGRPFQVAYASWRLAGAALGAGGSREVAGQSLREAHAIAVDLGAQPLMAAIETLARQARVALEPGAAPGTAGPLAAAAADTSGYDFTPREAEVLHLVTSGWTNQQIADALYITRKTASVHVSNLLAKLGVSNRGEAAALAVRIGLVRDLAPAPITSE
jgi:DNA-binding CsgD family transcriptional regulator